MNNEKMNQIVDKAYENYCKNFVSPTCPPNLDVQPDYYEPMSKDWFVRSAKERGLRGDEFSEKWGLKIEERDLSLEERCKLANFAPFDDRFPEDNSLFKWDEHTIGIANGWLEQHHSNLPTKLITVTYNNETIEVYE